MTLFVGAILQGLVAGSIIALLGAGITLVHRSTRVLNLAQGSIAALGAYVFHQMTAVWRLPTLVGLLVVLVMSAAVGLGIERAAVRPLRRGDATVRAVGTIAVVLIINWLILAIWGAEQRFQPALVGGGVSIADVRLGGQHLLILASTALLGVGLGWASTRTRAGLALAAAAQDPDAARLLGVRAVRVAQGAFVLAGALGGIAGTLATPLLVLTPSQMIVISVVSLGAALAGGFESLPRTIAAGLGIGVLQSIVTVYAPSTSGLPQIAGFLAVLALLAIMRRRVDLVEILRGNA